MGSIFLFLRHSFRMGSFACLDLRCWLTNLKWIWHSTIRPLRFICNIFKIHISWMMWAYGNTVSSRILEEHECTWEFIEFLDEREKSLLWGQSKDGCNCEFTLGFFSFFFPGCFQQFTIQGPIVFMVFHVLIHQLMEGYNVRDTIGQGDFWKL